MPRHFSATPYARTQQAILDAARAIIHEQGPDKLSMRAIADRIDYSPAGLYEYYGSKEEIIAEEEADVKEGRKVIDSEEGGRRGVELV